MDLAQAVRDAQPNDTLKVPAGRYAVNLELTRPITLLAMGQVVLDGVHSGSVVRITSKEGLVRLSGFTIVGGAAPEAGGAVSLLDGTLELLDCTLRFNKAPLYGGGGLYVRDGKATATRCRFEANTGRQGGAILVDSLGELRLEDSTVIQNAAVEGGGLKVKEGARVAIVSCTIADNKVVGDGSTGTAFHLAATTTRSPTLTISNSIISERAEGPACIFNSPKHPATLLISKSLLPEWCRTLGGDNLFSAAGFVMTGTEPYLLAEKSPAVGAADASKVTTKDVAGRARVKNGKADLGAFTFVSGGSNTLPY